MSQSLRRRPAGEPLGRGGEREARRTADPLKREIEAGLTKTGEHELVADFDSYRFDVDKANRALAAVGAM
jgi:hypothetical protein